VAHRIQVSTFLALTTALAGVRCAPARASPAASGAEPYDTTQSSEPIEIPEPKDPEGEGVLEVPVESPTPGSCDNDAGEVSCDFIDERFSGPACEGFAGSCGLLGKGYGYRKRVASAIARCWEQRGPKACNMTVRTECIRTALDEACPDPQYEAFCSEVVARCEAKRRRPDYTVEDCVKTLSAMEGRERDWAKSAIGSPSREGCKLMFTVY
jgi:hypothetical protein